MQQKQVRLGDVLISHGFITDEQLKSALAEQKLSPEKRLGSIFLEKGFVTEKQLLTALSDRMELPLIDLADTRIDIAAVGKIPRQIAEKYCLIATFSDGNRLTVVMNDPLNFYAVEDVRQITGMAVDVALDTKKSIERAIDLYYSEVEARTTAKSANESAAPAIETAEIEAAEVDPDSETPVVKVLNSLLVRGYNVNASDIHIEPFETHVTVRMRVDGVIMDYVTLSQTLNTSLVARIKILANLDIAERRLPQDGHFKATIGGIEMNIRVSIIPTVFGEKTVLRFLSSNVKVDHSGTFGMTQSNYDKFTKILKSPHGIIYITGPTGSGKTTTLYMVLEKLSDRLVNISTIEDPVERNIPKVNQVQVNVTAGLTFEAGLRSLLRQDPDIIMVARFADHDDIRILPQKRP